MKYIELDEDMIGCLVRMTLANILSDNLSLTDVVMAGYVINQDMLLTDDQIEVVYDRLLGLEKLFYDSAV